MDQETFNLIKQHVDASDALLVLCKTLNAALEQVSAKVTILEMHIREVEAMAADVRADLNALKTSK